MSLGFAERLAEAPCSFLHLSLPLRASRLGAVPIFASGICSNFQNRSSRLGAVLIFASGECSNFRNRASRLGAVLIFASGVCSNFQNRASPILGPGFSSSDSIKARGMRIAFSSPGYPTPHFSFIFLHLCFSLLIFFVILNFRMISKVFCFDSFRFP